MSQPDLLPIGEIARAGGTTVGAVRYYDELGLIASVTRVGGKRRFNRETIARLSFILRAQDAGFTLDEIGTILDDDAGGWHQLVEEKLHELLQRRDRLDSMIAVLTEMKHCGCHAVMTCPEEPTWNSSSA